MIREIISWTLVITKFLLTLANWGVGNVEKSVRT